jgi:hypothetical protein
VIFNAYLIHKIENKVKENIKLKKMEKYSKKSDFFSRKNKFVLEMIF